MGNCFSKTYTAADGVILLYTGSDISVTVPQRFPDMEVTAIGDGSFMDSGKMCQVMVPAGIKRIGKQAFRNCPNLTNVYLPGTVDTVELNAFRSCEKLVNITIYDYMMNKDDYYELISSSARINGTEKRLAYAFPEIKHIKDAVTAADAGPAYVQDGINRLFTSQSLEEERGAASLQRNLDGFSFDGSGQYATEYDEFEKTKNSAAILYDEKTEAENDAYIKTDRAPVILKTGVFTFDDGQTRYEDGKYSICINIKIGYHFWQSVVPVIYNGKKYYIYRRNYLLPPLKNTKMKYMRINAAIFSEDGIVTDREEARNINAKYKLLSIL